MKKDIHPIYYPDAKITCACGASFNVGSTEKAIHVEICSMCHPFYTGKEKLLDTAGRVDKFKKRMAAAEGFKKTEKPKKNVSPLKDTPLRQGSAGRAAQDTAKIEEQIQNATKEKAPESATDNK